MIVLCLGDYIVMCKKIPVYVCMYVYHCHLYIPGPGHYICL